MKPHVVFMGSTDFACPILQNLIDHSLNIVRVYTQPPRKSGRHHTKLKSTPVEILARKLNLSVAYPTSFDQFALDDFAALQPDLVIVAAYGLILPAQLLQMAKQNYLNLHASLLPRWRGAAPIERAIMAGDDKTGVTLMKMEPKLDCGPIIDTIETTIKNNETGLELTQRLSSLAALLLEKHIKNALQHNLKARPQPRQGVSYAAKLSSLDGKINWQHDHRQIFNQIRALKDRISVFFTYQNQPIFVHDGVMLTPSDLNLTDQFQYISGSIIKTKARDYLAVACKKGYIGFTKLQRPNRHVLSAKDFLNGFKFDENTLLS